MSRKSKKAARVGLAPQKRQTHVLGHSTLTGTRVLRPAGKGGTVSLRQVRIALRALNASRIK